MSSNQFLLPDVGEGLTEADLVAWHVAVGDTVAINDVICDIETAKSVVELPSPFAGVVQQLHVAVGDTVEVGTPIITIGDVAAVAAGTGAAEELDLSNPAATGGGEGESLVGRAKAERGPQRRRRRGAATPASEAGANTQLQLQGAFSPGGALSEPVAETDEPVVPAVAAPVVVESTVTRDPQGKVLAKPVVRRIARDLGIDLACVPASGSHGEVTREDVLAVVNLPDSAPVPERFPAPEPAGGRETRIPVKGVLRAMASAMTASAFSVPHVTEWITLDVTETMRLVERLRQRREFVDLKVTPLLVVAKACTVAMRRTPIVNSVFDAEAGEVVVRHHVNLGFAVATPRGLVVPNVKGADAMGLAELATAFGDLVETARAGRTQPADMADGTFTLTNVGVFGVDSGTPIINPGEAAIVAVGAVNRRPWVVGPSTPEERLEIRDVMTLAVSFDHRHIDGESASRFLADVAAILSDPTTALLF